VQICDVEGDAPSWYTIMFVSPIANDLHVRVRKGELTFDKPRHTDSVEACRLRRLFKNIFALLPHAQAD